jgi:hypothetical protein
MKSGFILHGTTRTRRTNSSAPLSPAFPSSRPCRNWDGRVKNGHHACEVFPSVATSSFIVRWEKALKSPACFTAQGITRRCLNSATMEADPAKACNQDDVTGVAVALSLYNITNSSFGGTLPKDSVGARVAVVGPSAITEIGELYVFTKERPDEGVDRINKLNNSDTNIVIQWQNPSGQRTVWKFRDSTETRKRFSPYFSGRDVHEVVYDALLNDRDFVFRYCILSDPFNFQVTGTNICLIAPAAAKARWLKWWQQHSDEVPATARRPAP